MAKHCNLVVQECHMLRKEGGRVKYMVVEKEMTKGGENTVQHIDDKEQYVWDLCSFAEQYYSNKLNKEKTKRMPWDKEIFYNRSHAYSRCAKHVCWLYKIVIVIFKYYL